MKTKMEISLNERDALRDMLAAEDRLLAVVPLHHTIETMLMVYPVTWILTSILFVAYHHWGHWLRHAENRAARLAAAAESRSAHREVSI